MHRRTYQIEKPPVGRTLLVRKIPKEYKKLQPPFQTWLSLRFCIAAVLEYQHILNLRLLVSLSYIHKVCGIPPIF